MTVASRLQEARSRVDEAAQAAGHLVTLVAVTKTVPLEEIRRAYEAGQRVFGENRVQEGAAKAAALAGEQPGAEWHLIGHLQSNKARRAVEVFTTISSVDSERLAQKLNDQAELVARTLPVLLEINVSEEESKSGLTIEQFWDAIPRLLQLPHLEIQGLMTIAPQVANPDDARPVFRRLRELRDEVRDRLPLSGFNELSMGMSNDYLVAIDEGATMVRLGRAIFGERLARH
ncbi:MAG: YggS family pyridoxal phosphate-dependent enzyme [Chloroflexota bacterium]